MEISIGDVLIPKKNFTTNSSGKFVESNFDLFYKDWKYVVSDVKWVDATLHVMVHNKFGSMGYMTGSERQFLNRMKIEKKKIIKEEDAQITVTFDTCVDVVQGEDRMVINPHSENNEEYLINVLRKNIIHYEILDEAGDTGWPFIEYTGTKEQLIPLFEIMSASQYTADEIRVKLEDWDGDEDDKNYEEALF